MFEGDAQADSWLIANEHLLAARLDWPPERIPAIRRWLAANSDSLSTARAAAGIPRRYALLDEKTDRLANVDLMAESDTIRVVARLLAVSAAERAVAGDWAGALRENRLVANAAGHIRNTPFGIHQLVAAATETLVLEQLTLFLQSCPDLDRAAIRETLRGLSESDRPGHTVLAADNLYSWDWIEAESAWSRNHDRHSKVAEAIHFFFDESAWLKEMLDEHQSRRSPFASIDDFRAALSRTSPQDSWRVESELIRLYQEWEREPLHTGLPKLDALRDARQKIAARDPHSRFWIAVGIPPVEWPRVCAAQIQTRRTGILTILALFDFRAATGSLPAGLAELSPKYLSEPPLDPFSGAPLRYRRATDGTFSLYSVGFNQRDDGGVAGASYRNGDVPCWSPARPEFRTPLDDVERTDQSK